MAYNKAILSRAVSELEDIHNKNIREQERRRSAVYSRLPELLSIDAQLSAQMSELARRIMKGEGLGDLHADNIMLQDKRTALLSSVGVTPSYLDDIFSCSLCNDTGFVNGRICSCLDSLYNQELSRELSSLLGNGTESFSAFRLSLYPEKYRDYMEQILISCKEYVELFPNTDVKNLIFRGAPGLGKTFMSACIAREVIAKGFSVYYESVVSAFDAFDKAQFRGDESSDNRVKRMLDCDLMILDDLGTEFIKPSSMSALYTIINSRISSSLPTIISTNLSAEDMEQRYSGAINSRINGYYTEYLFVGDDIRKKL